MSNSIEISVIMPTYNSSKFLKVAIDSILKQTFTNFEFIIVNDGSTDITENVIHSYTDNRIVYIKNASNLGLIASLNTGLSRAKGKYIARMDHDDIAMPERLAEQYKVLSTMNDIVACGSDYFLMKEDSLTLEKDINDSDYQKTILLFSTCFCHPTVMMRNVFKDLEIKYDQDFKHVEDYKLWTELAFHGNFYNVSKPLLKYRSHPNQTSTEHRIHQLATSENIRRNYLKRLGFVFSEEEFAVHSSIGNNDVIKTKEQLHQIELWLKSLVAQNTDSNKLNPTSFNRAIHKYWLDSCGHTTLGSFAYTAFQKSDLSRIYETTLRKRAKLFAKCVVRKFTLK